MKTIFTVLSLTAILALPTTLSAAHRTLVLNQGEAIEITCGSGRTGPVTGSCKVKDAQEDTSEACSQEELADDLHYYLDCRLVNVDGSVQSTKAYNFCYGTIATAEAQGTSYIADMTGKH